MEAESGNILSCIAVVSRGGGCSNGREWRTETMVRPARNMPPAQSFLTHLFQTERYASLPKVLISFKVFQVPRGQNKQMEPFRLQA